MTHATIDFKRLLRAVQSQLRTDLEQLAEEALQPSSCADRRTVRADSDLCNVDLEQMQIKVALRTLASAYVLLSRLDYALDPPQETDCRAPEPMSIRGTA